MSSRDGEESRIITFSEKWGVPTAEEVKVRWYKDKRFWVGLVSSVILGGFAPIFNKMANKQMSYGCMGDSEGRFDCEETLYEGFMASVLAKYIVTVIFAGTWYFVDRYRFKRHKSPIVATRKDFQTIWFGNVFRKNCLLQIAFSSSLDLTFTVFNRAASVYTRPSMVSMVSNVSILVSAIWTNLILRQANLRVEYIGISIVILGLSMTVIDTMLGNQTVEEPNNGLGIGLAFIGAICRGSHMVSQNWILNSFGLPAMKLQMTEALFGLVYFWLYLVVLWAGGVVDPQLEFWQLINSWPIALGVGMFGVFASAFNTGSTLVAKTVPALFRIIVMRMSSIFTWNYEMALGWSVFTVMVFFGYMVTIFGVIFYAGGIIPKKHFGGLYKAVTCCGWVTIPERASNYVNPSCTKEIGDFNSYSSSEEASIYRHKEEI